jgi:hypothetical protein
VGAAVALGGEEAGIAAQPGTISTDAPATLSAPNTCRRLEALLDRYMSLS